MKITIIVILDLWVKTVYNEKSGKICILPSDLNSTLCFGVNIFFYGTSRVNLSLYSKLTDVQAFRVNIDHKFR